MKANNIKALDYKHEGASLVLILAETSLEEVTGMDTALVEIRTDTGELVEALAGFALRSVTYNLEAKTYTAALSTEAGDTTAAALSKMASELETTKVALANQAAKMDYLSMMTGVDIPGGEA